MSHRGRSAADFHLFQLRIAAPGAREVVEIISLGACPIFVKRCLERSAKFLGDNFLCGRPSVVGESRDQRYHSPRRQIFHGVDDVG
jgi:hypothetical protein